MAKVRQALSDTVFDDYSDTRVTTMGHITEVVIMQKRCVGPPVVRIDKDHFMDLRTGELLEYEHIENRAESTDSIRRTLSAYIVILQRFFGRASVVGVLRMGMKSPNT